TNGTTQTFDPANQLAGATAAISLVGTAKGGNASTPNTVSVNLPAGTTAGDQIIVAATLQNNKTVTTPAGYTVVGTYTSGSTSTSTSVVVHQRPAKAGDTNVSVPSGATTAKNVVVAVYRGVDPTTPIDAASNAGVEGTTTVAVPSVTTTLNGDQLVSL